MDDASTTPIGYYIAAEYIPFDRVPIELNPPLTGEPVRGRPDSTPTVPSSDPYSSPDATHSTAELVGVSQNDYTAL